MSSEQRPPIYIVCPMYHQAQTLAVWLRKDLKEWLYINDDYQLRGKREQTIIFFANWRDCPKCMKLHEGAQAYGGRILYIDDR